MNKNKVWQWIEFSFFALVIVACIVLSIVLKLRALTLVSAIAGILYVVFLSDRNIFNFLIGLVSTITYIIIAWQTKLYGEVVFYAACDLPMIIVSFFMWKKHVGKDFRVDAKRLKWQDYLIILAAAAVGIVAYAQILRAVGGNIYWVDATSSVASIIATILMCLRYREQWFMWIVVYVISVVMWSLEFDLLMLIMSSACLLSSIIGFVKWTISSKQEANMKESE